MQGKHGILASSFEHKLVVAVTRNECHCKGLQKGKRNEQPKLVQTRSGAQTRPGLHDTCRQETQKGKRNEQPKLAQTRSGALTRAGLHDTCRQETQKGKRNELPELAQLARELSQELARTILVGRKRKMEKQWVPPEPVHACSGALARAAVISCLDSSNII